MAAQYWWITDFGGSTRRWLGPTEITDKATQTFEDALKKIRPAAAAVVDQLRQLVVAPDEIGRIRNQAECPRKGLHCIRGRGSKF